MTSSLPPDALPAALLLDPVKVELHLLLGALRQKVAAEVERPAQEKQEGSLVFLSRARERIPLVPPCSFRLPQSQQSLEARTSSNSLHDEPYVSAVAETALVVDAQAGDPRAAGGGHGLSVQVRHCRLHHLL